MHTSVQSLSGYTVHRMLVGSVDTVETQRRNSRGALTHLHWSQLHCPQKQRKLAIAKKKTRDAVYRNDCTSFSPEPVVAPTCMHTMHAMKLTGKMQAINAKHGGPISIKAVLCKRPSKSCWEFHMSKSCWEWSSISETSVPAAEIFELKHARSCERRWKIVRCSHAQVLNKNHITATLL